VDTLLRRQRARPASAASLELASIPLTILVTPPCVDLVSLVLEASRDFQVNLLQLDASLSGVDPRAVVDLAILNLKETDADAPAPLNEIRTRWPSALIICLNVASEAAASRQLESGADFALSSDTASSFAFNVLRAAARRLNRANAALRITFGDLVFDRDARRVWCANSPVMLTEREFQLFEHLFLHADHIVSYRALTARAWRADPTINSNALAVYVGYLRRKLKRSRLTTLIAVRGEGYGLVSRCETMNDAASGRYRS
jgi:DNA-binding response OmpR family regulator